MLMPLEESEFLRLAFVCPSHVQQHIGTFVLLALLGGPAQASFAEARAELTRNIIHPETALTFGVSDLRIGSVNIVAMSIQLLQTPSVNKYSISCFFAVNDIRSGRPDIIEVFRDLVRDVCKVCIVDEFVFGLDEPLLRLEHGILDSIFFWSGGDGGAEIRGDTVWGQL